MLSDEEKKAYDNLIMLKYFTMEKEDKQAIVTILNLIEKQSKEIEELKEINEEMGKALDEWINGERTSIFHIHKDKIKAKIEEIDNQKRQWIEDRDNKHKDSELIYAIEVLQSLLEKE